MIKGVKKNVIVVEPPKKSSFEKIFFIMKVRQPSKSEQDMLTEANRIIAEGVLGRSERSSGALRRKPLIAFGVGFIMGAALGMIVLLLML